MADRLADRFRNLERARRPKGMSTVGEADGRIGAIESGAGQAAPNPSMARSHLERFQTPAEPGLDTTRPREGAQPFTRCQRCETDNSSFTGVCSTCGADLGTREQ